MIYRSFLRPILFSLSPETAHELALAFLSLPGAASTTRLVGPRFQSGQRGRLERFGLQFENPVGLAAGFDKNGRAADVLAALGFGFVEVGTVTSEAQSGNEKPRLFRLPADQALINRLGFNNCGARQLVQNIRRHRPACVLGINIGKSRRIDIDGAIPDYLSTFETVYDEADYIAVNVSSPNTPNLRELQRHDLLAALLEALQQKNGDLARAKSHQPKPLLVKIAPDLSAPELESIIDVARTTHVAGIIATNTTVSRSGLTTPATRLAAYGDGGLSGAPLRVRSNEIISSIYRATKGQLPIIGAGGIFTADDAWAKICAGACLIQIYTGFIYEGPTIARRINRGLAAIMAREGFTSIDDAVGSAVK